MTSAAGDYTFAELPPGTYTVAEVSQDGWHQTYPNAAVGRAPVSNVTEASYFVSKTVEYETTAHPNATGAVWLGEQLDSWPTWGSHSKIPIREDTLPDHWTVTERYDSILED